MITAPRKSQPRLLKYTKRKSNPYAWRQGRQLWSLFWGLWGFSALLLASALYLMQRQFDFFINQAYRAFPAWVSFLEREQQVTYMAAIGILILWSPVLFWICKRWTKQSFEPLIFFHEEINSLVLKPMEKEKKGFFPSVEFHEFYQSYAVFFEEMRMQRIMEAELLRKLLETQDLATIQDGLKELLQNKEWQLGANTVKVSRPTNGKPVSPDGAGPRRRVS